MDVADMCIQFVWAYVNIFQFSFGGECLWIEVQINAMPGVDQMSMNS